MLMLRQVDEEQLTAPPCGEKGEEEEGKRSRAACENIRANGRRQWDCQRCEPKQVAAAWRGGLDDAGSLHRRG